MEETDCGHCLSIKELDDDNCEFGLEHVQARMPTKKYATHYNMNHKYRGIALIFNHKIFDDECMFLRIGSTKDTHRLNSTLTNLGFDVRVYEDLKQKELIKHINKAAKINHTKYDCFAVFVLTHSIRGELYARDKKYKPKLLWSPFLAELCPTLAGKPKLFFVQACQDVMFSMRLPSRLPNCIFDIEDKVLQLRHDSYKIPSQADFLIFCSTTPECLSRRIDNYGSVFINSLCEELERSAYKHDILTILTFVAQTVVWDNEYNMSESEFRKYNQVPNLVSMLTRLLVFNIK